MVRSGYLAAAALAGAGTLLLAAGSHGFRQTPQPPAGAKSGTYFKNIRILKNLPANQLMPTMQKISQSLGVRCDFCHDVTRAPGKPPTGFEKDTKKYKGVARQMLVMVQDINKRFKVVENKVTCYTCHKGKAEPVNHVPTQSGRSRRM